MNKDIFDLVEVRDLPGDLQKELIHGRGSTNKFERRLIALFDLTDEDLNIDQLQVGYFRKHKEYKLRRTIVQKLYILRNKKNPAMKAVKGRKGLYRRIRYD